MIIQSLKEFFPRTVYAEFTKQKECRHIYNKILTNLNVKPLNATVKHKIKTYATKVLGNRNFSSWLYVYSLYRGTFYEGWIPEDFFKKIIPRINGVYCSISAAKTLTSRILQTTHLPDKAYHINGSWFNIHGDKIKINEIKDVIFDQNNTAYIKLDESKQGKGIILIHRDTFDESGFRQINKNFVIQRAIIQAGWFEDISPGCVATIRVTTGLPVGDSPKFCAAYLRVGRKGSRFITSEEALRIPVIDDKGTLGDFALDKNWNKYSLHPDTGVSFKGKRIPYFLEAVSLCEKLHEKVQQFTIIGWDVAITESGFIELMEWNVNFPDIKFSEATTGPCFRHIHLERFV